jgi:hypothetical protein
MSRKRWLLVVLLAGGLAALALLAAACGDDGEEAGGGPTAGEEPAAGTVGVSLIEWSVVPDTTSVPAGTVTFEASNDGEEEHEFVVIRSDLEPGSLPLTGDMIVDETQVEVLGEIEEFAPGGTESASFDLEPGNYVLICNVLHEEGGETERHYQLGMRTAFEVTG